MSLPKRKLDELISIHKREPSSRELFVEGPSDRAFIELILSRHVVKKVVVYEIEKFEVEPHRVLARNLEDNNRGRVITLAYELEPHLKDKLSATCVADRDFDAILGINHKLQNLLLTDYTCMEGYAFNTDSLSRFLGLFINRLPQTIEKVIEEITSILGQLFAARMANQQLRWGMKPVTIDKSIKLKNGSIVFDFDNYVNRYLKKPDNNKFSQKNAFIAEIERCQRLMNGAPPPIIQGHDLSDLLAWYVNESGVQISDDVARRSLLCTLAIVEIAGQPMFTKLLTRTTEA